MKQTLRFGMGMAALFLLFMEIIIAKYADGWVRNSLGDVLVVMLIYATARTISPMKPDYRSKCGLMPALVLLFSFITEGLQAFGIADMLGIRNGILRTVIGTTFSEADIFCYILGSIPCYIIEIYLKRNEPGGDNR